MKDLLCQASKCCNRKGLSKPNFFIKNYRQKHVNQAQEQSNRDNSNLQAVHIHKTYKPFF